MTPLFLRVFAFAFLPLIWAFAICLDVASGRLTLGRSIILLLLLTAASTANEISRRLYERNTVRKPPKT
jgi:hypothetical protein